MMSPPEGESDEDTVEKDEIQLLERVKRKLNRQLLGKSLSHTQSEKEKFSSLI